MQSPREEEYSAFRSCCHDQNEFDDDFSIDEIALTRSANDLTDDELFALLDGVSENVPATASNNVPATAQRCIPRPCPKMSQNAARRSAANDRQIIEKIQNFDLPTGDTSAISLVGSPHTHPNSNATPISLPTWEKTSDAVKLLSSSIDLMTESDPATAFVVNLPAETIAKARASKGGVVDYLKRNLDKVLARAGLPLSYWFCLDIDDDDRLHVHGMFSACPESLPVIRDAMKQAWGEWTTRGKRKQIWFNPRPSDEGWARYSTKYQNRIAKIVGKRTFTIKNRAGAEHTYSTIRRIMADYSQG